MSATSPLPARLERLPYADEIWTGLSDLNRGEETKNSLLIQIAATRLAEAGLDIPPIRSHEVDAEIRLYLKLGEQYGVEGYAKYNALLRGLSSFCRALEGRVHRQTTAEELEADQ